MSLSALPQQLKDQITEELAKLGSKEAEEDERNAPYMEYDTDEYDEFMQRNYKTCDSCPRQRAIPGESRYLWSLLGSGDQGLRDPALRILVRRQRPHICDHRTYERGRMQWAKRLTDMPRIANHIREIHIDERLILGTDYWRLEHVAGHGDLEHEEYMENIDTLVQALKVMPGLNRIHLQSTHSTPACQEFWSKHFMTRFIEQRIHVTRWGVRLWMDDENDSFLLPISGQGTLTHLDLTLVDNRTMVETKAPWISEVLSERMENLRELSVTEEDPGYGLGASKFTGDNGEAASFEPMKLARKVPKLVTLSLQCLRIHAMSLCLRLEACSTTLTTCKLSKVRLIAGSWTEVFEGLASCQALTALHIEYRQIADGGSGYLNEILRDDYIAGLPAMHFPSLQALELAGFRDIEPSNLGEIMSSCEVTLRTCDLQECLFKDDAQYSMVRDEVGSLVLAPVAPSDYVEEITDDDEVVSDEEEEEVSDNDEVISDDDEDSIINEVEEDISDEYEGESE